VDQETPIQIEAILGTFSEAQRPRAAELLPLVLPEIRALAATMLRSERPGHTLQPTALVNEAYMKLAGQDQARFNDRSHFLVVASRVMRRLLVDHARARSRDKRTPPGERLTLSDVPASHTTGEPIDLLALEEALHKLAALNPRGAEIVELRFFGGLGAEEVAQALGIARSTAAEEWRFARAWLSRELKS